MKAYLFVSAAGEPTHLAAALRAVPGVIAADATTGDIDVIAVCEASGLVELNAIVTAIHQREDVIESHVRVVIGPAPSSTERLSSAA
ncbi:MAG: Lrp/AsnC ligand binding domain-containing protein [Candidatus Dormibacterales bacterium]